MAGVNSTENLREEATCSVCLDYFKDPVIATCGHNFCRSCITQYWEGLDANFPCPQCRDTFQQRILIPNRQLANMTEITKQLLQKTFREPGDVFCEKHNEALKLFCDDDQKPICVVCSLSRDHKAHTVCPIEEALQNFKEKLQQCLHQLRGKLGDIQVWQSNQEKNNETLKIQKEGQRKIITSEFEELRRLLNAEEQVFLDRLNEEKMKIQQKLDANIRQLKERSSALEKQIAEIEEKFQQPVTDFLKGIRTILSRGGSMNFQRPEDVCFELGKTSCDFLCQNIVLNKILKNLKVSMVSVTLDPETVNPYLILSEDQKLVRRRNEEQELPMNPKRFDVYPCVLGLEGFTCGRHYWEVQVGNGESWSIGVARESVSRKGKNKEVRGKGKIFRQPLHANQYQITSRSQVSFALKEEFEVSPFQFQIASKPKVESTERGIWALEQYQGQYQILSSPVIPLALKVRPQKLGVYLDYDGGRLSFYNVDTTEHLYTFTASFTQKIFPYFCIRQGSLSVYDFKNVPNECNAYDQQAGLWDIYE